MPPHAIPEPRRRIGSVQPGGFTSERTTSNDYVSSELTEEAWQSSGGGGANVTPSSMACSTQFGLDKGFFQNLWHDDPVGITVTKLDHTGFFFYDGECVQYIKHTARWTWFRSSGWGLSSWQIDVRPSDPNWSYVDANAWGQFRNSIFCVGSTQITWVHYWPNQMRAFRDGYYTFNWNWYADGGCSSWLQPRRSAGGW